MLLKKFELLLSACVPLLRDLLHDFCFYSFTLLNRIQVTHMRIVLSQWDLGHPSLAFEKNVQCII